MPILQFRFRRDLPGFATRPASGGAGAALSRSGSQMSGWAAFASLLAITVCADLGLSPPAAADTLGNSDSVSQMGAAFWRLAAQVDLRAAHDLIADNHPAMLAEAKDPEFRKAETRAIAVAQARADKVKSYEGYTATLGAYAVALKDAHIWDRPTFVTYRPEWAGIVLAKRLDRWLVVDEEVTGSDASLLGAALISCDGTAVERMAEERLGGFRVDWSVGAQQIHAAPWLLVDEHNPFLSRPNRCTFAVAGTERVVKLQWRMIKRDALTTRLNAAIGVGAAGFGIRKAGAGYWISLQSLVDSAEPVVAEVAARKEELRNAPFVVIDLRGNTGGSSIFGTQIAQSLMGAPYVDAKVPADDSCDEVWRASDGNLAQLRYYRDVLGPTRGSEFTKFVLAVIEKATAARARGRVFSGPTDCPARAPTSGHAPPSLMRGRLILLTDSLCFSSCLVVTHDMIALGALHLGQTTDSNTHYSEVREVEMPSGLSKFSTLQSFSPGTPIRYGPFVPAVAYGGDMSDTKAVEGWVLSNVSAGRPGQ